MLDNRAGQIFAISAGIAERERKNRPAALPACKRLSDNDADYVDPLDMLAE